MKPYLYGGILAALLAGFGFAYWHYGHTQFGAGKAAGDIEVATLKANYAAAYSHAQDVARSMQAQADAQALAYAKAQAQAAQQQLSAMAAKASAAQASADQFQRKLNDARKHDPTVDAWLRTRIPDGVRAASTSSGG